MHLGVERFAGLVLTGITLTAPAAPRDPAFTTFTQTQVDTHPNGNARYLLVSDDPGSLRCRTRPDWASRAHCVLARWGKQLGLEASRDGLQLARVARDIGGGAHVRLRQHRGGLPVEGGVLDVHFSARGLPVAVTGLAIPVVEDTPHPGITPRQAVQRALASESDSHGTDAPPDLGMEAIEWTYFSPAAARGEAGPAFKAYKVTIAGPALRRFVYVNAADGTLLGRFEGIHTARSRSTLDMDGSFFYLRASVARLEGQGPVGDRDVDNAHDFAGDTYDFYWRAYGRDSIDDAGQTLVSYVDYGRNFQNAFWNGSYMTYGEGMPVDDVAAHEITHGLTQNTANLLYFRQSGALNEGFSDIFGETVDQLNGAGSDNAEDRWLLGEDLENSGFRNMADPTSRRDPDRVDSPLYRCGLADNGGVHSNSGVPNKNYVLLVDGGTFQGRSIPALGIIKAAAIHYQDLIAYLTPFAQFQDHFRGLWRACNDLIGTELNDPVTGEPSGESITPADCESVVQAGLAVGFLKRPCP